MEDKSHSDVNNSNKKPALGNVDLTPQQKSENLNLFFEKYEKRFQFDQDPSSGEEILINATEPLGAELAKFARDNLGISVNTNSKISTLNAGILELEKSLETLHKSSKIGRKRGKSKKASEVKEPLHTRFDEEGSPVKFTDLAPEGGFERPTPANSKHSDARKPIPTGKEN